MRYPIHSPSFTLSASLLLLSAIAPISWICLLRPLMLHIQANPVHATAIPWLQSEAACLETGRSWDGETCWDAEHDPNF